MVSISHWLFKGISFGIQTIYGFLRSDSLLYSQNPNKVKRKLNFAFHWKYKHAGSYTSTSTNMPE